MEYVQERIPTLHSLTDHVPEAPIDQVAVVVPMTEREYATHATECMLTALETADPGRVVIALRATPQHVQSFREWLGTFEIPLTLLWCSAPRVHELLDAHGLDGDAGKGRDVWLALGIAALDHPYVVCHDADTKSYTKEHLPRLAAPLTHGMTFTKAYYARVENNRLYGRLFRLFFAPLIRTLVDTHAAPILEYLQAFRYALAGEFATTADLAHNLRIERRFGLEVGTLGDAFTHAGFRHTAQVDLGTYEHDHRAIGGPTGLSDMSHDVGSALFRILEANGVTPDFETLPDAYQTTADTLIAQYAADAAHNGLDYDQADEHDQVTAYRAAIEPPGPDDRLPAWTNAPIDPQDVLTASQTALTSQDKG